MPLGVRDVLVPTLAALVLAPAFAALGFWQLGRSYEKHELQAQYDQRAARPAIVLGTEPRAPEALQFFRVRASGAYDSEYQILRDNRIHHGVTGFHVITPFHIAGGETHVLVNRGWVPAGPDRAQLPAIDPPRGAVTIIGVAVAPRPEFSLGQLNPLDRTHATIWQQLDLARYAKETGWRLQPIVVLLDPQNPGGYVREWARLDVGAAVHQSYAFQLFLLSAAVMVVYAVLLARALRRVRRNMPGSAK